MGHLAEAEQHLEAATASGQDAPLHLGIAAVHALLHLAETMQHSLRDILYELRS